MNRLLIASVSTAVIFATLDGAFLAIVGPRLYRPEIGSLLAEKVRLAPAVLFYLIYISGLVYFAVRPGLEAGWSQALVSGAILGLVAYAAYDLTCAAVMTTWSVKVTVADMAWGALASAAAAAAGTAIARRFGQG